MSGQSRPTFNLGPFIEIEKLKTNGSNFTSWFRTLRILLVPLKMSYVLETALGDAPATTATPAEKNVYLIKSDDSSLVQKGMLYAMDTTRNMLSCDPSYWSLKSHYFSFVTFL